MSETFKYRLFDKKPALAVIELGPSIMGGSDALEFSELLNFLKSRNIKCILTNLEAVKTINSSGLGMLVAGLTSLRKDGVEMVLTNVPEKVKNLLEITHLDKVFKSYPSIEKALENC